MQALDTWLVMGRPTALLLGRLHSCVRVRSLFASPAWLSASPDVVVAIVSHNVAEQREHVLLAVARWAEAVCVTPDARDHLRTTARLECALRDGSTVAAVTGRFRWHADVAVVDDAVRLRLRQSPVLALPPDHPPYWVQCRARVTVNAFTSEFTLSWDAMNTHATWDIGAFAADSLRDGDAAVRVFAPPRLAANPPVPASMATLTLTLTEPSPVRVLELVAPDMLPVYARVVHAASWMWNSGNGTGHSAAAMASLMAPLRQLLGLEQQLSLLANSGACWGWLSAPADRTGHSGTFEVACSDHLYKESWCSKCKLLREHGGYYSCCRTALDVCTAAARNERPV